MEKLPLIAFASGCVAVLLFCICNIVCKRKGIENSVNLGTLVMLSLFSVATAFLESIVLYAICTLILLGAVCNMCWNASKKKEVSSEPSAEKL